MWNRMTLRIKITLLTAFVLVFVTVCITALSILNANRNFVVPFGHIRMPINNAALVEIGEEPFDINSPAKLPDSAEIVDINHIIGQSQAAFNVQSIITAIAFIITGTFGVYLITGRALKPITTLTARIEDIDENNLHTQIEPSLGKDEVSRLTHSFNNMLEKLNRSFEHQRLFAQNAAHELKTPLTSIMTNIDVLQMDDEPSADDYKEVIGIVKISTKRLIELVGGLLALNNTSDGGNHITFNCMETFLKITDEMREAIDDKNISVSIIGDCQIKGDKTLLERAFSNLVQNAVRYNVHEGSVRINLDTGNIIIEDSGIGIPAESLSSIFEPFYCVDKSRSKKYGGNGLGLAVAKSILEAHKIRVQISSELGKGTKILLQL